MIVKCIHVNFRNMSRRSHLVTKPSPLAPRCVVSACAIVHLHIDKMSGPAKDIRLTNPKLQGEGFTHTVVPAVGGGPARSGDATVCSASAAAPSLAVPSLAGPGSTFVAAPPPPPARLPQKGDAVGKGSGKNIGKARPPKPSQPYAAAPPITSAGALPITSAGGAVIGVSLDPDTPPLGPATAGLAPPPLQ